MPVVISRTVGCTALGISSDLNVMLLIFSLETNCVTSKHLLQTAAAAVRQREAPTYIYFFLEKQSLQTVEMK